MSFVVPVSTVEQVEEAILDFCQPLWYYQSIEEQLDLAKLSEQGVL